MRRRDFLRAIAGSATGWSSAARAQQDGSIPKIGVLWPGGTPPVTPRMESFREGLRRSGYVEGRNVTIELRYAEAGLKQLPDLAADLIRAKVDVIATFGDLATKTAQQLTSTIPIITLTDDALGAGLVSSCLPVGPHERPLPGREDGERSTYHEAETANP